jgi:hypothetical protein
MRHVRHFLVLAGAISVGVILSACGGDSSPEVLITVPTATTASSSSSLTKEEFIAQADQICAETNASIQQFAAAGQGETEAAQIAQLRQDTVDKINALGPPADDKTTLDQYLSAMADQVAAGQKIGLAVQRGEDTAEFDTELQSAKSDAETAASTYGFQDCGQQISGSTSSSSSSSSSSASSGTATPAPSTGSGTAGGTSGGSTGSGTSGSGTSGSSGGSSGGIGPG